MPTTTRKNIRIALIIVAVSAFAWIAPTAYYLHQLRSPAGTYTESTYSSCNALHLTSDGNWTETLHFVKDGEPKYTMTASGTWQRASPDTLIFSSGFLGEARQYTEPLPVRAQFTISDLIFTSLKFQTTVTKPYPETRFKKSFTGDASCPLAGFS